MAEEEVANGKSTEQSELDVGPDPLQDEKDNAARIIELGKWIWGEIEMNCGTMIPEAGRVKILEVALAQNSRHIWYEQIDKRASAPQPPKKASDKQKNYIRSLVKDGLQPEADQWMSDNKIKTLDDMTTKQASDLITFLKSQETKK